MLVKFKSKEFESKLRETAIASKVRLQEFLETIEQLDLTTMSFDVFWRNQKGLLETKNTLFTGYQDRHNYLIDMDKFTKLKSLTLSTYSRVYAHKWSRTIENMNLCSNATQSVFPMLNEFTNLKSLTCDIGKIDDDKRLPKNIANQLEYFQVCILKNMSFLEGFDNLLELNIRTFSGVEFNDMPTLGKVKRFSTSSCKLENLEMLSKLPNIEWVDLTSSQISDLSYVKELPLLKVICVSNANLWSIEPLRDTAIETLDISHNMVEDISPLETMQLIYLCVKGNPVADLSALRNQTELELLHFKETWVTDISPILELENLKEISLDINNLSDKNQLTLLKSKPIINGMRYDEFIKENVTDSSKVEAK